MLNLRDLGGLPLEDGGVTASGRLLRSDAPYPGDPSPAMAGWPPAVVIDLRSSFEVAARAHPLQAEGTTIHHLSLSGDERPTDAMGRGPEAMHALYRITVTRDAHRLARIAGLIAHAPGPALVHCASGKDRTGLVIAGVLRAVGVRRDAVEADYVRTRAIMPALMERYMERASEREREATRAVVAAHPGFTDVDLGAMQAFLDDVDRFEGGAAGLLVANGLPAPDLARLRRRLADNSH